MRYKQNNSPQITYNNTFEFCYILNFQQRGATFETHILSLITKHFYLATYVKL